MNDNASVYTTSKEPPEVSAEVMRRGREFLRSQENAAVMKTPRCRICAGEIEGIGGHWYHAAAPAFDHEARLRWEFLSIGPYAPASA